ncbi:hypothetical protein A3715_37715 [Oleiphilus sp. HI0009]|nr:hypothetical protein A3715_38295 [Oleiphilus sp. HI0009]KZX80368.1 hypothetical protein A3715_37715 [Oleiphilus sp. HI0009]
MKGVKVNDSRYVYSQGSIDILESFDIDWYAGPENLSCAPHNWEGLHTTEEQKAIFEALSEAKQMGDQYGQELGKNHAIKILNQARDLYSKGELFQNRDQED